MHASQPELRENIFFTFLCTKYPKCKPEHAKHESNFISQQELHQLQLEFSMG